MRYTIREQPDHTHRLYRYGELAKRDGGRVTNSELEFWQEIESLREQLTEWEKGTAAMKAGVAIRIGDLESEIERLNQAVAKMSHRKCRDCGNVAYHLMEIVPHVLCEKCGSHDTRRLIRERDSQ